MQRNKGGDPPIQLDGLQRLKELVYFILYFEIELYRTSRTIKGDTNGVLGRTKYSKLHLHLK